MNAELSERSNEAKAPEVARTSVVGFIARFTIVHTVTYFIAGMIFFYLVNYRDLFSISEYAYMRPPEHPLVILGPSLQILRGAFLAVAFLPFRKVIVESKRGWLYLFVAVWFLMHVGADASDPGKIEGFIYADYTAATHFATWPESIFSSLTFAWLFHTWERNPKDKRLLIPMIVVLVIMAAFAVLGLLFS